MREDAKVEEEDGKLDADDRRRVHGLQYCAPL